MKIRNISILLGSLAAALFSSAAFANEGGATAAGNYNALGAGIGIAIAVFGGAIGQSRAAAAALEGISRNPAASKSIFTPMLLALALIEALVILAWLVCFIKIPV